MWTYRGPHLSPILHLRPVGRGDLDLLRAHRNADPSTFRDPMHVWESDHEAWFLSLGRARQAFMVVDPHGSDPVRGGYSAGGWPVGLVRLTDFDLVNHSVGYTGCDVFEHARGRGWATKICAAVAEYCFADLGMHRVWGEAIATNEPMLRALRRAGFRDEARFREAIWRGGKWHDFLRLARLSTDPLSSAEMTPPDPFAGQGPNFDPGTPAAEHPLARETEE